MTLTTLTNLNNQISREMHIGVVAPERKYAAFFCEFDKEENIPLWRPFLNLEEEYSFTYESTIYTGQRYKLTFLSKERVYNHNAYIYLGNYEEFYTNPPEEYDIALIKACLHKLGYYKPS